ncbi:MAG TPA: response regulator [Anaerolineales bacterium]|nr:response regulator [Anaerolineales bacterium]
MQAEAPTLSTPAHDSAPTILLVDDEPSVLAALKRALRPDGYRILTAESGAEALELLEREPVAVIVSDQRMPRMSGAEFLELARQYAPDTGRIMLTGYAEPQAIIDAINRGGVYRYISKPWDDGDLRLTLRRAIDQHLLIGENRLLNAEIQAQNAALAEANRTLERRVAERTREVEAQRDELKDLYGQLDQNFADVIRVFVSLLELRDSREAGHSRRVAAAARFVAEQLHLAAEEVRDIEFAAQLHEIGKLSLPDTLLGKSEAALTPTEREMVQRCPVVGQAILMGIGNLQAVGRMIYHHRERYDGLGYPERIAGDEIPLGARIIAAADALDRMVFGQDETLKRSASSVRDELARQAGHQFDPRVVLAVVEYLEALRREQQDARALKIALHVLQPGMTLARDLVSAQGALLMPRGTLLSVTHVERIRNFARVDALGAIYVFPADDAH